MSRYNRSINLGAGISLRPQIAEAIVAHSDKIDAIEIITERFIGSPQLFRSLIDWRHRFTIIPHGVRLSIGSPDLDFHLLKQIKKICDIVEAPYYTEHLCMTKAPGIDLGHLAPLWITAETLKRVIQNIHIVQDYLNRPLVLENITYKHIIPGATLSFSDFLNEIVNQTGAGLLLDVTNIYTNSVNHQFDPYRFIDQLPLHAVYQCHVAGGRYTDRGELIDSHSAPVETPSWELLDYVCQKTQLNGVILERDCEFPADFSVLLNELEIARKILNRSHSPWINHTMDSGQL